MAPLLVSRVGHAAGPTVAAPAQIAPRAWILGVMALQVTVVDGAPAAQLRAHATGQAAPSTVPLVAPVEVHVALVADAEAPWRTPTLPAPAPAGAAAARLTVFLDGESLADSALDSSLLRAQPPARGFGHVFCRWLRDGGCEPGFDLTAFAAQPEGRQFARLLVRSLAVGQIVSYRLV